MKGKLIFYNKDKDFFEGESNYSIFVGILFDYEISVYMNLDDKFEDIINETDELSSNIDLSIDYYSDDDL